MGLDLTKPGDNIKYGLFLFNRSGIDNWSASKKCWKPLINANAPLTDT